MSSKSIQNFEEFSKPSQIPPDDLDGQNATKRNDTDDCPVTSFSKCRFKTDNA